MRQERRASARRGCSNATAAEFAGARSAVSQALTQTPLQVRFRNGRGVTPPALVRVTFARRRICDFCDVQTYMHRSGGREPAVASGTAPATTIPHTFGHGRRTRGAGAAGVSRPCVALTHLQMRYRNCSAHCRPVCWRTPLQSRSCNHGGLTPRSCSRVRMRLHRRRTPLPKSRSITTAN